jgi:hypothetical protein
VTGPAGAFHQPTQVAITAPPLSQLNSLVRSLHGFGHYTAATGFGLLVSTPNGQSVKGLFARPLSSVVSGPTISELDEKALDVISASSAATFPLSFGQRQVSFRIETVIFVVILNPALPAPRHRPAPTRVIGPRPTARSGGDGVVVAGISVGGALLVLAAVLLLARARSPRERTAEEPIS